MFRMNGQFFCSRQKLSTYIHVGNAMITGSFTAIHGITTLMCPYMSCERMAMFRLNGQVISSRQKLSTYIQVGNAMITGSFTAIHGITTLMCPYMSCERMAMFRLNGQVICSRHNLSAHAIKAKNLYSDRQNKYLLLRINLLLIPLVN